MFLNHPAISPAQFGSSYFENFNVAVVAFFCRASKSAIEKNEFYIQDIHALESLGHEVVICSSFRELLSYRWDMVFIWWWTYALFPVLLALLRRKPCLITGTFNFKYPRSFHGYDYFSRPWWQRLLISTSLRLASLNLFVSLTELKACKDHFNLNSARFFPHILPSYYLTGPADNQSVAILNIAWRGRLNLERKGVPELLKAISILKRRRIKIPVYLVGRDGDGSNYLNELIIKLDLHDCVFNLGEVSTDKKKKLLRECEIYVQPSHYEGFGVAVTEAMGAGSCIITCDVGAVREVVADAALYAEAGSAFSIAKCILRVYGDHKLRRSLQKRAFERAKYLGGEDDKIQKLRHYLSELGLHA